MVYTEYTELKPEVNRCKKNWVQKLFLSA